MDNQITDQRQVFRLLSQKDQIATLYDMIAFLRNEQANDKKEHLAYSKIISYLEGEIKGIPHRENILSTTDRIQVVLQNRFAWLIWYRDHVLASTLSAVQTIIVLYILYSVFGGKLPTP